MPSALITGITGQDGSYLAELLLEKGYQVFGVVRRTSHHGYERIEHLLDKLELLPADLLDQHSLTGVVQDTKPDEVYNLGAQSYVPTSWAQPVLTGEFTALGVTRILEAVRLAHPEARFYQASSSEMFGKVVETPQRESTPFHPRSPYGVAKVYGHWITVNYRESRSEEHTSELQSRDWGFAGDYVDAMWRMLQQPEPEDYVIGTGVTHSVRDLIEIAFARLGLEWQSYVKQDPKFIRPAEVDILLADPSKAKSKLDWEPRVGFEEMIQRMVDADLERLASG